MNDGFPLRMTLFLSDNPGRRKMYEAPVMPMNEASDMNESWEPEPSPYEIPGELVLAKEKRSYTQCWPAKLMRYIPPRARGEKAQYEVLFYDGKVKTLPDDSDMFFNEVHPNFKSCRVRRMQCNPMPHFLTKPLTVGRR